MGTAKAAPLERGFLALRCVLQARLDGIAAELRELLPSLNVGAWSIGVISCWPALRTCRLHCVGLHVCTHSMCCRHAGGAWFRHAGRGGLSDMAGLKTMLSLHARLPALHAQT